MSTVVVDSPAREPVSDSIPMDRLRTHPRVSWAAIFGAVILVIAIQVLLSLLGAGIGLGTVGMNEGSTPTAPTLGIGAGLWWVVSSFVALLAGGYVAGWLAGIEVRIDGALHGLITWGIATLLAFWLLSSALGNVIGGGFSTLRGISSVTGKGVGDALGAMAQGSGLTPQSLSETWQSYLQPTVDPAAMSAGDANTAVAKSLAAYARGGADADAAKQRVIAIMAAQSNISQQQAAARFDQAQAELVQARDQAIQTAKDAADTAASIASKSAFAAFGVMLLGAVGAAIGGSMANQPRLLARWRERPR